MFDWLKNEKHFPKLFWQAKGSDVALGAVGKRRELLSIPETPDALLFGGMTFSPEKRDPLWNSFPPCYFFEPLEEKTESLVINLPFKKPTLISRTDSPTFEEWEKSVQASLADPKIEKVVLARRTTLTFKETLCPWEILSALRACARNATLFGLQITPEAAFIGATPEKLYARQQKQLFSEAIAGTRLKNGEGLGEKEQREFDFVKTSIQAALTPLSHAVRSEPQDRIIQTATLEHFYNRLSADLKDHVSDADLLHALHPTAAIGGQPRREALQFLVENEPFDRGWYASPIGWVGPGGAEMVVGIRSALVCGHQVHLFAGAGIVPGSDARKEWEELDHKIGQLMGVLT